MTNNPLKLITLNIEGRKHLSTVLNFLKSEDADIICLQEIFKEDFEMIKSELSMNAAFFPMSNRSVPNEHYDQFYGVWGICILCKLDNIKFDSFYYTGKGNIPLFIDNQSDDRVIGYVSFKKNMKKYVIGTTHFYFTPNGKPTEGQWKSYFSLIKHLKNFDSFVLCGDFNSPRGGEIYTEFTKNFIDHLPKDVDSTIDTTHHKVKDLLLVIDTIFSTKDYKITDVHVKEGLSDHKAIIGYIH